MTTILILSCGTRNKLVRFFKEAFHSLPGGGRVIVTDCSPWAPALYEADAFYLVPPMKDPGYEDRILEICMREQVNALLPLFEDELDLLAQNRKKFFECVDAVINLLFCVKHAKAETDRRIEKIRLHADSL